MEAELRQGGIPALEQPAGIWGQAPQDTKEPTKVPDTVWWESTLVIRGRSYHSHDDQTALQQAVKIICIVLLKSPSKGTRRALVAKTKNPHRLHYS
jgi:hypothetical protein